MTSPACSSGWCGRPGPGRARVNGRGQLGFTGRWRRRWWHRRQAYLGRSGLARPGTGPQGATDHQRLHPPPDVTVREISQKHNEITNVCLSVCLSVHLSACLSVSVCRSVCWILVLHLSEMTLTPEWGGRWGISSSLLLTGTYLGFGPGGDGGPTGAQSISCPRGRGSTLTYRTQKSTGVPDLPAAATISDPHRSGCVASARFGGSCGTLVGPKIQV